jgi:cytochrome c-type biogenesis protein CcmH/NrfG
MLLNRVGRHDEARQQLTLAVEEFRLELKENPNSPLIWSRMGDSLATMGDFKAASDAFGKAVVLDPGNIENLYNLAKTLEFQGRFSESIAAAQKAAILASGSNQQQLSAGLNEYLRSLEQKKSQQGQ